MISKFVKLMFVSIVLMAALITPIGATIVGMSTQYGNVTATESTLTYHIEYAAFTEDSTFNLLCKDNVGYFVQVYGSDIKSNGVFDINWNEILWGITTNDCIAEIDSNGGMI